jgi:folate-binding protein YgfZ
MGVWFGCDLPDSWGNPQAEEEFARNSVALIDKNYRAYLSFTGSDRVRYLNAILTNNIKDLANGQGNVSLLLSPQGRILAEIETYAFADKLFCFSYAMIRERLIETIEKYIIMDDVTLTDETQQYGTLAFEGPQAAKIVSELTAIDLAKTNELSSTDATIGAIPCRIVKRSPDEIPGAEFVVERRQLESLWNVLESAVRKHGGGPMGYSALSAHRLAQGVPWFGYDFGEKQIPHEAGLQDSHISYTKGCYTGQEIVERVRSRGQVNRQRVHLIFTGASVPAPGEPLTLDGKEVGFVTRAAMRYSLGAPIGMAYIRRENAAAGSELRWTGGTARVSKFPEGLTTALPQK